MKQLTGTYTEATIYATNLEDEALKQIQTLIDNPISEGSKICMMPDAHAGKGCTIGTTMTITDKVCPNLVGVDIGCFVGDTRIPLLDGTQATIADLSKREEPFYVYSVREDGLIVGAKAIAFKTRTDAPLMRVTITGGAEIICTPDHKFMQRDGSYKEAQELKYLDSLMPLYRTYQTRDGYESIVQPVVKTFPNTTHKLMATLYNNGIPEGYVVHHKDFNKFNNTPENLQILTPEEHSRIHAEHEKNVERLQSDDFKAKRIQKLNENGFYHERYRDKKRHVAVQNITDYMKQNPEGFAKVVQENAERGSKFFTSQNSDEVMKTKQKVAKYRKILLDLQEQGLELNEENYETSRVKFHNFPKFNKFQQFLRDLQITAENVLDLDYDTIFNNHKVISVEPLDYTEDVYCLNVPEHHNFALSAGVFVHNCGVMCVKLVDVKKEDLDLAEVDKKIRSIIPLGFNTNDAEPEWCTDIVHKLLNKLTCKDEIENIDRIYKSVGTLGGGNHYIELNEDSEGHIYLVIHTGSRNLGQQVAKHHQKIAEREMMKRYEEGKKRVVEEALAQDSLLIEEYLAKHRVPKPTKADLDLACLTGDLMKDYLKDMAITQEYASINRSDIAAGIIEVLGIDGRVEAFESVHNYIDLEHGILRKGAISARDGEHVIIPLNMRDGSILAIGKGNPDWNYSAPHGAGRIMSRKKAQATLNVEDFERTMSEAGVFTTSVSKRTLDEAPFVYKNPNDILDVVGDTLDIIEVIKPIYNLKG